MTKTTQQTTTAATWDDVRQATADLDAAAAAYDANPSDATSIAWEAAQDALNEIVRDYRAGRRSA